MTRNVENMICKKVTFIFAMTLLIGGVSHAQQGPRPTTLPGGASSLQETYSDWKVSCVVNEQSNRVCAISQQQFHKGNKQRIFGIELQAAKDNSLRSTLILPFGLELNHGVNLRVDEGAEFGNPFYTCLPSGCLVVLNLDQSMVNALKAGTMLGVKSRSIQGSAFSLDVSLAGFTDALSRLNQIVK